MNNVLETALHDVLPTVYSFPQSLKNETTQLYHRSRSVVHLRAGEEAARYHICAILAVNKLKDELGVLGPSIDRVPLPPRTTRHFINLFNKQIYGGDGSGSTRPSPLKISPTRSVSTSSTKGSPIVSTMNEVRDLLKTPRKRGRPKGSTKSPTKSPFMQRLEQASGSLIYNDISQNVSPSKSPSRSPLKRTEIYRDPEPANNSSNDDPFIDNTNSPASREIQPQIKEIEVIDGSKSKFKNLNSLEITSLCNKFQLPSEVTHNIIKTFQKYYGTVSNEWIMLCGLVVNSYFVIHHDKIRQQLGAKSMILKTIFNLQNGGLLMSEMKKGIEMVRDLIEYTRWFKKLKQEYGFPFEQEGKSVNEGTLITEDWRFVNGKKKHEYDEWLANTLNEVETELGESNQAIRI